MQNSNIVSNWADELEMDELCNELTEDIEMVNSAYQSISKFCKKGGRRRNAECFDY